MLILPFGSGEAVRILSTGFIASVKDFCDVNVPSATCTMNVKVPSVVGVPEITPVEAPSVNP